MHDIILTPTPSLAIALRRGVMCVNESRVGKDLRAPFFYTRKKGGLASGQQNQRQTRLVLHPPCPQPSSWSFEEKPPATPLAKDPATHNSAAPNAGYPPHLGTSTTEEKGIPPQSSVFLAEEGGVLRRSTAQTPSAHAI